MYIYIYLTFVGDRGGVAVGVGVAAKGAPPDASAADKYEEAVVVAVGAANKTAAAFCIFYL